MGQSERTKSKFSEKSSLQRKKEGERETKGKHLVVNYTFANLNTE